MSISYPILQMKRESFFKKFWRSKKIGWQLLRISFMLCIGMAGFTMLFEEKFIFFPSKYPSGRWELPKSIDIDGDVSPEIQDSWFQSSDGINLHGWLCTRGRHVDGVFNREATHHAILWCHGNAGNISDRFEKLLDMSMLLSDILIFDYRGYGRSEGTPSESGLYLDTEAAWNYLVDHCGYQPGQIVIYGNSLGGVPAIDLATKVNPAGLIVQSSFTSIRDMAAATMPLIPRFLVQTKMNSQKKIPTVDCPKLFIHSVTDEVVPYKLGRRLFEAAKQPKAFYQIPDAGHNEIYIVGRKRYFTELRKFLDSCTEKYSGGK